jgi:hypothetical protein
METLFVIELILIVIVVAAVGLKTLRDLQVRYPCRFAAYPDDEDEDEPIGAISYQVRDLTGN